MNAASRGVCVIFSTVCRCARGERRTGLPPLPPPRDRLSPLHRHRTGPDQPDGGDRNRAGAPRPASRRPQSRQECCPAGAGAAPPAVTGTASPWLPIVGPEVNRYRQRRLTNCSLKPTRSMNFRPTHTGSPLSASSWLYARQRLLANAPDNITGRSTQPQFSCLNIRRPPTSGCSGTAASINTGPMACKQRPSSAG